MEMPIKLEFLLIILAILLVNAFGNFIDYTENTELIQQRTGLDVKLQCNLKGLVDENKIANIQIHWYFKQCGDSFPHASNCHDFFDEEWTSLPCEQIFCSSELLLRNVTEKYSGLYKCAVYPYRSDGGQNLDIQLVRTYQLDVRNNSIAVPEFLDSYPLNQSVKVGTQVVFQCYVHSETHPTIKWFRRQPETIENFENVMGNGAFNAHLVHYNGHTYELLTKAQEKVINNEIYLSKLILNNVEMQDEGHYACVAISYHGHKIREAYLEVLPIEEDEYWVDYDLLEARSTDPKQFWLLFLMPLGLAMPALSVWLGYLWYKHRKATAAAKRIAGVGAEQYFEEELSQERCMLRGV